MITRRSAIAGAFGAAGVASLPARAQEITFFRIMTGGTVGTYFPIGGLIANAISNPPGSRPCNEGGSCGVPGLVATSVASNAPVATAAAIVAGTAQSGFVHSDIAFWAYTGSGTMPGGPRWRRCGRSQSLSRVSTRGAQGIGHQVGHRSARQRVSLDEPGSGTLVDARLILAAYGLGKRPQGEYFRAQQVADNLKNGTIDAFFSVSGWPQSAIAELAATVGIELVPIAGPQIDKLLNEYSFFGADVIPDDAYKGVAGVKTISVHALWVTSSKLPDELIYNVTAALWNPNTRKLLDSGHAKGRDIRLETALTGLGIPLHAGAEKFYKERGLIK